MENAVDAIIMAFAVIVFVMALSVSMSTLTQVKATSDVMLYTEDETNYYTYQGATGKAAENRIVGLETIVPTLYKYYKENYTVVFKQGHYDMTTGDFTNWRYLPVYKTPSNQALWKSSYATLLDNKYGMTSSASIFSFDLDEETLRYEPWTGSNDKIKHNLDCFLTGETYYNPNNNQAYINYGSASNLGTGGFIAKYADKKFVETIAEYTYTNKATDSTIGNLTKDKKKRVIIFTLIGE